MNEVWDEIDFLFADKHQRFVINDFFSQNDVVFPYKNFLFFMTCLPILKKFWYPSPYVSYPK